MLRTLAASAARALGSALPGGDLVGKSRIWPTLDFTINSEPRYLLMVLALAGDSTITRDLPMKFNSNNYVFTASVTVPLRRLSLGTYLRRSSLCCRTYSLKFHFLIQKASNII